jgi:hypothetical protein
MNRRAFFGTLLAVMSVLFLPKRQAPRPKLTINKFPGFIGPSPIDPSFPFKPFAELPADIEAMDTIKTNGDELLLVVCGGTGYLVDKHGTMTRL